MFSPCCETSAEIQTTLPLPPLCSPMYIGTHTKSPACRISSMRRSFVSTGGPELGCCPSEGKQKEAQLQGQDLFLSSQPAHCQMQHANPPTCKKVQRARLMGSRPADLRPLSSDSNRRATSKECPLSNLRRIHNFRDKRCNKHNVCELSWSS